MKKPLKIGLFGFGVVGKGLYDILVNNKSLQTEIIKICVKHKNKARSLPLHQFTFDKNVILDNKDIDLIIEMIDDPDAAFDIVSSSLKKGVPVVTSNKKMVAIHMEELVRLQKENNTSLLYEASACSSIPIIRTLEEYFDNDLISYVSGIFNSSTNYILSKIFNSNQDFDIALKQAQDLGFAESDSSLDTLGYDALYKLCIVSFHAYGQYVPPKDVLHHGIHNLSKFDIHYAAEKGYKIKEVAMARKIDGEHFTLFVLPQFIKPSDPFFDVDYEYNGVVVDASFCDKQLFKGKGAGGHPTGFAVMSDVSANAYNYRYEYKKTFNEPQLNYTSDVAIEVYFRYFDKKNLDHFQFEKIMGHYTSKDFNYIIGTIQLKNLFKAQKKLNSADVQLITTGKLA